MTQHSASAAHTDLQAPRPVERKHRSLQLRGNHDHQHLLPFMPPPWSDGFCAEPESHSAQTSHGPAISRLRIHERSPALPPPTRTQHPTASVGLRAVILLSVRGQQPQFLGGRIPNFSGKKRNLGLEIKPHRDRDQKVGAEFPTSTPPLPALRARTASDGAKRLPATGLLYPVLGFCIASHITASCSDTHPAAKGSGEPKQEAGARKEDGCAVSKADWCAAQLQDLRSGS